MATWTVKSQTDDLARALEIVGDQRAEGYTVWIENESGEAVDERTLETVKPVATKRIFPEWFPEWLEGPLFISAFIILGLIVLYLIGLWVDR
jgi:hypothetical protein